MKKILLLAGIATLVLSGCEREYRPIANFSVNNSLVIPGEIVNFYNNSSYADYYEWDFGDGYISNAPNPNHYYSGEGVYEVRLTAYNDGLADYTYMQIEVYETTLEIEVREYYSDEIVPYVDITLYSTYDDWLDFSNELAGGTTTRNGKIVFKGLDDHSYFIDAYRSYYGNEDLGFEDINFIKTLPLSYATHNFFVAYVDYYPEGKVNTEGLKSTERVRKPVIKEFKRVYKDRSQSINN
ncbi:MAG: PKD domain-containing protein [Bacteroidales bacterium]|nr:PKD domain-containing protein [Bacteroidales bacterium]